MYNYPHKCLIKNFEKEERKEKRFLKSCCDCLDLFQLKYEDKWVHTYELAKASLNNRGNEIRCYERRSNEMRETDENNDHFAARNPNHGIFDNQESEQADY